MASQSRAAAGYHGDQAAVPGMLDFAVDVRASEPPSWLVNRLAALIAPSFRLARAHLGYALCPRDEALAEAERGAQNDTARCHGGRVD